MERPKVYFALRKNGISGIIETECTEKVKLHFSEWWNGEGMDFTFTVKKQPDKTFSLSLEEMAALVSAAMAVGMIDMEEIDENVQRLNRSWDDLKNIKNHISYNTNYPTMNDET